MEKHTKVMQYGPRAQMYLVDAESTVELDVMLVLFVL